MMCKYEVMVISNSSLGGPKKLLFLVPGLDNKKDTIIQMALLGKEIIEDECGIQQQQG